MLLRLAQAILLALALCADCFAVSACSSVSLRGRNWKDILPVSGAFAFIQTALFFAGVFLGDLVSGYLMDAAHVIGFLLLLYVGGSMLRDAFKGEMEERNLSGFRNVMIGGLATSIDALSVGASMAMDGRTVGSSLPEGVAIASVTFLTVVLGIIGGSAVGKRFGRPALYVGGCVLLLIGLNVLLGIF